jgi:hypothetical protein
MLMPPARPPALSAKLNYRTRTHTLTHSLTFSEELMQALLLVRRISLCRLKLRRNQLATFFQRLQFHAQAFDQFIPAALKYE